MSTKIRVAPDMVNVLTGGNHNADNLFDGNTNSAWFPGWNPADYPAKATIDLKNLYNIEKIRLFDGTGTPSLAVTFGLNSPTDVVKGPITQKLSLFNQWWEISVGVKARFITLELLEMQGDRALGEVEVFGELVGNASPTEPPPPPVIPPVVTSALTGDALKIATNCFHWVPLELLAPFSFVREYQMWTWMEQAKGTNRFEPSDGGAGNFDSHYTALKAKGIQPIAVINQTPEWLLQSYPANLRHPDNKPVQFGADTRNPASYKEFARFMFQLAARYGRNKVSHDLLTVNTAPRWTNDPANTKRSGLDLLHYIEVWNEPDKWWAAPAANFAPEEYAAMLSACYDGHEGRLGATFGIKTADPTMKVVMAGLTNLGVGYLKAMDTWFKANRTDKIFPADILNLHHYSNKNQQLQVNFVHGIAPEDENLREKLEQVVAFRNANFAGKELWLSEFGYDTGAESPQRATAYGSLSAEEVQAIWIMRSYLAAVAAGIDKAFVYNIIDEDSANGLFQTSGLTKSQKAGFGKKAAWQKVANLVKNLDGMTFKGDISPSKELKLYCFGNKDKNNCFAWSCTSNGSTVQLVNPRDNSRLTLTEEPVALEVVVVK